MPTPQVLTAGGAAKIKDSSNSTKRRSRTKKQQTAAFDQADDDDAPPADYPAQVTPVEDDESPLKSPAKQNHVDTFVTTTLPEPKLEDIENEQHCRDNDSSIQKTELVWLLLCFLGIMASFVCYGLLLEYTTSGGRHLHELSFLFVTSSLYTVTAAAGRYVRDETPTTIPPARFAILGLTSMGSTFCSVRSLRYVIYPIQVLAKSCKPVPVMIMGAFMVCHTCHVLLCESHYNRLEPIYKWLTGLVFHSFLISTGQKVSSSKIFKRLSDCGWCCLVYGRVSHSFIFIALLHVVLRITIHNSLTIVYVFLYSGDNKKKSGDTDGGSSGSQILGIFLLFVSLCFDGGTGAYEDKLMSVHSVQPFDLMYNIQLGKTILAGVGFLVLNQVHVFLANDSRNGLFVAIARTFRCHGTSFIFITISKFGALTCSIIGLARKVTTLGGVHLLLWTSLEWHSVCRTRA